MKRTVNTILLLLAIVIAPFAVSQETQTASDPRDPLPVAAPDPGGDGLEETMLISEPEADPAWEDLGATTTTSGLRLFANSSPYVWIKPDGKVGIGTSAPAYPFTVSVTEGNRGALFSLNSTIPASTTEYDISTVAKSVSTVPSGMTNSGYSMGIDAYGYLKGAGTLASTYGLRVVSGPQPNSSGTVNNAYGGVFRVLNQGSANGSSIQNGYGVLIQDVQAVNAYGIYQAGADDKNYFAGRVGIGTGNPGVDLEIVKNLDGDTRVQVLNPNGGASSRSLLLLGRAALNSQYGFLAHLGSGYAHSSVPLFLPNRTILVGADSGGLGLLSNQEVVFSTGGFSLSAERMRIAKDGNVGIGTTSPSEKLHVAGNAFVSGTITGGNIQAKYQDIAEWVPTKHELTAGTVVVLDESAPNHVAPSALAYDTAVAGVITGQPGLVLGEGGDGKTMVATTGRVRVKADATTAPIAIGDLLVTSGTAGVAMRSEPIDLSGHQLHRPGTILGKALEPLADGTGEILILLSLQ